MNKFFRLIYINLLSLFDINKIAIAKKDGVKSNLENKNIITGFLLVAYIFIVYSIFSLFKLNNCFLLFNLAYLSGSLFCLVMNVFVIEPLIFKNEDNDILFSLPLTRQQILFSKLFNVYLKNIFAVAVLMISAGIVFYNSGTSITDTQVLMIIIGSILIPIIPMIIATVIAYINDYFKIKMNNNYLYKICKYLLLVVLFIVIYLLFKDIHITSLDGVIETINEKLLFIYPYTNIFYIAVYKTNLIYFFILIFISILLTYLYFLVISSNYQKICSLLKGVKKKEVFHYKKTSNLGVLFGLVRKEFKNLFNNKGYFSNTIATAAGGSIILFLVLLLVDIRSIKGIEDLTFKLSLYVPPTLALFASLSCSTISAMSLEKDNIQILRTMPISVTKILLSKWLVNVFIGIVFVLINGTLTWYFLELKKWDILFIYLVPLIGVMFVALSGLLLDYRFIEKNETNDNAIIKQRLITLVPMVLSLILAFSAFILPYYTDYRILLGCYMFIYIILMIIEVLYMIVNHKKLIAGLIN